MGLASLQPAFSFDEVSAAAEPIAVRIESAALSLGEGNPEQDITAMIRVFL
jgi:hypothetical protein